MRNPARTLRIAGPVAIVSVTIFYLAANLAYLFAATKEEITGSGRLVASLLFRNVWGPNTERVLSGFVALSALGNVLSVVRYPLWLDGPYVDDEQSFSQGRVNQALGREGILLFSKIWASDWPCNGPLAGLSLREWLSLYPVRPLTGKPRRLGRVRSCCLRNPRGRCL